jgi:hypothetical protein
MLKKLKDGVINEEVTQLLGDAAKEIAYKFKK